MRKKCLDNVLIHNVLIVDNVLEKTAKGRIQDILKLCCVEGGWVKNREICTNQIH